ncbi:hypothetical protein PTKIN_Ptkin03bG0232800 [Pterospermum kingtungense]
MEMEMELGMRSIFPEDFSRGEDQLPQPITDPNYRPSSSSSLRSSPDSSLIFTIPINDPHQQAISQMRSNYIQLPTLETENAAITRAMLAVLTTPSPSSSSSSTSHHHHHHHHHQQVQNLPCIHQLNSKASAFKSYGSMLGAPTPPATASLRAQSMLKRAIVFYRKINSLRLEQLLRSRPSSNQVHHMMCERKRREKLNENFYALRSLLPSGIKKDKASLLASAKEHLTSLRAQIVELSRQNQILESLLLPSGEANKEAVSGSSNERINVRITPVMSEATSEQRIINLRVSIRGETPMVDILIHLLEFLKLDRNVNLVSIEANTQITELGPVNHVNSRLRIEGDAWDESSFQEAVLRRLVHDLPQ